VARGAGDAFQASYEEHMANFAGGDGEDGGDSDSQLERAASLADDEEGRQPIEEAMGATEEWRDRHGQARDAELAGEYNDALRMVIGAEDSSGEYFTQVNSALDRAVSHEQSEFEAAADAGRGALTGLAVGAVGLAVLGAVSALVGIGRRLSEYR
jgi:hypothetical protein